MYLNGDKICSDNAGQYDPKTYYFPLFLEPEEASACQGLHLSLRLLFVVVPGFSFVEKHHVHHVHLHLRNHLSIQNPAAVFHHVHMFKKASGCVYIYIYIIGWNLKPDMSCMLHANYLPLLDAQMISKNWWPCNKLHNIYINIFPPHWPLKKGRSKTSKLRRPQAEEIQLIQRSTKPILQILRVTSACCFEGYNVCFGHLRFLVWNICESHPLDHFNSLYHFAWHLCARNNMCTSCRST